MAAWLGWSRRGRRLGAHSDAPPPPQRAPPRLFAPRGGGPTLVPAQPLHAWARRGQRAHRAQRDLARAEPGTAREPPRPPPQPPAPPPGQQQQQQQQVKNRSIQFAEISEDILVRSSSSLPDEPAAVQRQLTLGTAAPADESYPRLQSEVVTELGHGSDAEGDVGPSAPLTLKDKVRKRIFSPQVQAFLVVLVLVDLTLLGFSIHAEETGKDARAWRLHIATTIDASIFFAEVLLRAWSTGVADFFFGRHRVVNRIEFLVIATCVVLEILQLADDAGGVTQSLGPVLIAVFRLLRFCRLCRLCAVCAGVGMGIKQLARGKVSKGRRRLVADGYDLDLAYVTPRVLAMSWPGSGVEQFFRNSINTVSSYLDKFHPDCYKVYNLCKERGYDTAPFHGRVERVMMDDHNAGDILQLRGFCESAEGWHGQSPDNVIVVHCKAGKGRTGTCICSYLIWTGLESSAEAAMRTFAHARTEGGFSGVESPSQARYLHYFDRYVNVLGKRIAPASWQPRELHVGPLPAFANYPSQLWLMILSESAGAVVWRSDPSRPFYEEDARGSAPVQGDARKKGAKKKKGAVTGAGRAPPADSSRYSVEVRPPAGGGAPYVVPAAEFYRSYEVPDRLPPGGLYLTYDCSTMPPLTTDTRLHWFNGDIDPPVAIGDSQWWAWFHPAFEDIHRGITLGRAEVDGPHKDKSGKRFSPSFTLTMRFVTD
eukprot:TRINITY_DN14276_c0_g1_i3.p1 TRINITY_DN14276_c0_g1~~TRINITY_DN14276_c0_g1_i3.p1  ORF type:complete len:709 (+),score=223.20 TRINITY_DN14276_c0_g1_i3:260-2386(+)